MIVDGLKLIAGGDMVLTLTGDRKGDTFPDAPQLGDLFEMETNAWQFGGIFEFTERGWVLRNPLSQLLTYDISGTVFGSPEPGAKVIMFSPPRTLKFIAHESTALGSAVNAPEWEHDFEVVFQRDGALTGIGIIRFEAGSTSATFIPTSAVTEVRRGDLLMVFAPYDVDPMFADISLTLTGVLSI